MTSDVRAMAAPAMIRRLEKMTAGALKALWLEVFGEEARSGNRVYLWRRLAWRIQADREGGLSDRAIARARELARESDIRLTLPKAREGRGEAARAGASEPGRVRDRRLPGVGATITRAYKGRTVEVTVTANGFQYEGRPYRSLSAVARAVTGAGWNGFLFFGLEGKAK